MKFQVSHHLTEDLARRHDAVRCRRVRCVPDGFDTMDLDRMVTVSDLGQGTIETLQEAAELLCRAYPSASASELRMRTKQRLNYITRLISGRCTLDQHRELLVTAGWLALLLGCLHYDLGEREKAEAARQAAYHAGLQAGHGEIIAWSYELAAWFALTEGRYHDVVAYTKAVVSPSSGRTESRSCFRVAAATYADTPKEATAMTTPQIAMTVFAST